jgi:hypothetical protein
MKRQRDKPRLTQMLPPELIQLVMAHLTDLADFRSFSTYLCQEQKIDLDSDPTTTHFSPVQHHWLSAITASTKVQWPSLFCYIVRRRCERLSQYVHGEGYSNIHWQDYYGYIKSTVNAPYFELFELLTTRYEERGLSQSSYLMRQAQLGIYSSD